VSTALPSKIYARESLRSAWYAVITRGWGVSTGAMCLRPPSIGHTKCGSAHEEISLLSLTVIHLCESDVARMWQTTGWAALA
jgi:hypothetical protein